MAISFGGFPVIDPVSLLDISQQTNVPTEPWYRKVNSFRIPIGEQPGRGYVAMYRADFNSLNLNTSNTLIFDSGAGSIALQKIEVVRYWNAFGTNSDDVNSIIVLELADRRVTLTRNTNQSTNTGFAFNAFTTGGRNYVHASLDPSTGFTLPYTWQRIMDVLWNDLFGTSAPTLPFTPHGTPSNFNFFSIPTWKAINNVCTRIGCAVVYRPDTDTFSIIRLGVSGSIDANAKSRLTVKMTYNSDEDVNDRVTMPEKINVNFKLSKTTVAANNAFYSSPATSNKVIAVTPTPAPANAISGTRVDIPDDLVYSGLNLATITARATERAADWSRIYNYYSFHKHYIYTFKDYSSDIFAYLGSQGFEVAFYDFGGGEVCEATAGEMPVWEQLQSEYIINDGYSTIFDNWPDYTGTPSGSPGIAMDANRVLSGLATICVSSGAGGQVTQAMNSAPGTPITKSVAYAAGLITVTMPIFGATDVSTDTVVFQVPGTDTIKSVGVVYTLTSFY